MDYSKFFRKEMPLAVPHQKPPSKYASHPYPVLIDEKLAVSYSMIGTGYLIEMPIDAMSLNYSMSGEGELRGILISNESNERIKLGYTMNGTGVIS